MFWVTNKTKHFPAFRFYSLQKFFAINNEQYSVLAGHFTPKNLSHVKMLIFCFHTNYLFQIFYFFAVLWSVNIKIAGLVGYDVWVLLNFYAEVMCSSVSFHKKRSHQSVPKQIKGIFMETDGNTGRHRGERLWGKRRLKRLVREGKQHEVWGRFEAEVADRGSGAQPKSPAPRGCHEQGVS